MCRCPRTVVVCILSANHPYMQLEGWITKGAALVSYWRRNIRVRCEINTNGCQQPLLVQVCCYFCETSRSYGYHTTHAVNTKVDPPKSDLTTHENIQSVLFHNLLLVTLQLFLSHHKQQLSNSCLSKMLLVAINWRSLNPALLHQFIIALFFSNSRQLVSLAKSKYWV